MTTSSEQVAPPFDSVAFIQRLSRGPSYLFLGQKWLRDQTGVDRFLDAVHRKFIFETGGLNTYKCLFEIKGIGETALLEWMAGRSANIAITEKTEATAKFPWNGVLTSAIDDVLPNYVRNPAREVQRVLSMDYTPIDPRAKSKVHIWYFYGNVASPDDAGRPPLNRLSLIRRQSVAMQMASKLPELVTALGLLCIEGYDPRDDWFGLDSFYAALSSFHPGQAHWFEAPEGIEKEELVSALIQDGRLTVHKESLAHFLTSPALATSDFPYADEEGGGWAHRIRIAKRIVPIQPDVYRQIQTTGRVVPESAFIPTSKTSAEKSYAEFRAFLYESSHRPSWDGYNRRFAFLRDFQSELEKIVRYQLSHPSQRGRGEPIILHGASGSGKTVALGQLAFDIQRDGVFPVIFVDHGTRVRNEALDRFCLWAEEAGASAVAVIWDGMVSVREYLDLHSFLTSRGRKFVLIGSAYQTDVNAKSIKNSVFAEPAMKPAELEKFLGFLKEADFGELIPSIAPADETTFLGQLYRTLPATRFPLQAGLGREVAHASEFIRNQKIAVTPPGGAEFGTNLGNALADIGIILSAPDAFGDKKEVIAGEEVSDIQQLIGLVMVPGQFGHACPLELLMRTLTQSVNQHLVDLLERIDIFQVSEDSSGNPFVAPRTALEAQLIARRTLGGVRSEVEYAIRLLKHIRSSYVTASRELDFAVDLLRSMGPNGQRSEYYKSYFSQLAECLHELRSSIGVRHVRLLLQESALWRESAKALGGDSIDKDESAKKRRFLDCALDAGGEALKLLPEQRNNRLMRSRLLVELASTWGTLVNAEDDNNKRFEMLTKAHEGAWEAFKIDSGNHFALDVVAWTARDALNAGGIPPEKRVNIIESVTHAFALAEAENWDSDAAAQLDRRRYELRDLIFSAEVSQAAFQNLLNRGSAAGIVVRAWQILGREKEAKRRRQCAREALTWMQRPEHESAINNDEKAQFLKFKLWWLTKAGDDFNSAERLALAFSASEWQECYLQVSRLLATDQFEQNPTLRLIEAVALFHLNEFNRGFEAFESLNTELPFARNRVIRRFLLSDEHGRAKHFSGTVVRLDGRDGAIQVQGFGRWIKFFVQEVGRSDIRRGDDISGFAVAFNMLGPIAEFKVGPHFA